MPDSNPPRRRRTHEEIRKELADLNPFTQLSRSISQLTDNKFEVAGKITTNKTELESVLLRELELQFKNNSLSTELAAGKLVASKIGLMWGSLLRADRTEIFVTRVEDGYLLNAKTDYMLSGWGKIIIVISIFTIYFWIIPTAIWYMQKTTVRKGITENFEHLKTQHTQALTQYVSPPKLEAADKPQSPSHDESIDFLEKWAALKGKGIISEADFEAKKKKILGI